MEESTFDFLKVNRDIFNRILFSSDYNSVRAWASVSSETRRHCNDIFWSGTAYTYLNLNREQTQKLLGHKPSEVTHAVYYKWLELWAKRDNAVVQASRKGLIPVILLHEFYGQLNYHTIIINAIGNNQLAFLKWLRQYKSYAYYPGPIGDYHYIIRRSNDWAEALTNVGRNHWVETASWLYHNTSIIGKEGYSFIRLGARHVDGKPFDYWNMSCLEGKKEEPNDMDKWLVWVRYVDPRRKIQHLDEWSESDEVRSFDEEYDNEDEYEYDNEDGEDDDE